MKPYFAKYLPVEGEVEIGDLFFSFSGKVVECLDNEGDILYGPMNGFLKTNIGNKKSRRAKLFLCSRDVQVGDKVRCGDDAPSAPEHTVKFLTECKANECYKVIGEISKDALQGVKEGDEFEESDVQFWHGKRERASDTGFVIDPSVRVDWVSWVDFVKIKCPWGHFH